MSKIITLEGTDKNLHIDIEGILNVVEDRETGDFIVYISDLFLDTAEQQEIAKKGFVVPRENKDCLKPYLQQ